MEEQEYRKLAEKRDELRGLLDKPLIHKHRVVVEEQLLDVRNKLKDAHYERYHKTRQS